MGKTERYMRCLSRPPRHAAAARANTHHPAEKGIFAVGWWWVVSSERRGKEGKRERAVPVKALAPGPAERAWACLRYVYDLLVWGGCLRGKGARVVAGASQYEIALVLRATQPIHASAYGSFATYLCGKCFSCVDDTELVTAVEARTANAVAVVCTQPCRCRQGSIAVGLQQCVCSSVSAKHTHTYTCTHTKYPVSSDTLATPYLPRISILLHHTRLCR